MRRDPGMRRPLLLSVLVLLCACGASTTTSPPPASATSTTSATTASGNADEQDPTNAQGKAEDCVLVCGGAAALKVESAVPDYHAADVANADAVFASMHDDLLACYQARIKERPNAHGFLVVDVIVAPDGKVGKVETTGGALLGERAMKCIVDRVERATFDPVRGGGTLHVQVPLAFTRAPADDTM